MGLVVQFRADSSSSSGSEGEQEDCHNVDDKDGVISTHQLDTILNSIANQDLDSKLVTRGSFKDNLENVSNLLNLQTFIMKILYREGLED